MKNFAVIFDMDGVIVDNTKYHVLAWKKFANDHGKTFSTDFVKKNFMGRLGREIMRDFIGIKKLSKKEINLLDQEREAHYRKIYKNYIEPVKGLEKFLKYLKSNKIKTAIATAAPPVNVEFVMHYTKLRKYFDLIVDANGVKKGKPDPEIYLKAAKKLKLNPKNCLVFEDALMGIQAAQGANMKVVALTTTHHPRHIGHADLVVNDFTKISIKKLQNLF